MILPSGRAVQMFVCVCVCVCGSGVGAADSAVFNVQALFRANLPSSVQHTLWFASA